MATYGFPLAPKGLKPVSRLGSALISPTYQLYAIDPATTASIGNNEIVNLTAGYLQVPAADTAVPNGSVNALGVFAGVEYKITQFPGIIRQLYWVTQTAIIPGTSVMAKIVNDPDIYYEIQTNSATGLTQAMIGLYCNLENINFIDGSINGTGAAGITQGQSTAALNITGTTSATPANGTGLFDVQIVGLSQRARNVFATTATPQPYNYAIVKLNSYRQY